MITEQDLKQFVMLGYLSESMLTKLTSITEMHLFDTDEMIFKQEEKADHIYLLKKGNVLLEHRITGKIKISTSSIKPMYSFGWSAMLDDERYSSDAVCAEASVVYSLKADKLKQVMEADHSIGYIISRRLLHVIKKRYDVRTAQFVKTIESHPEISSLL